MNNLPCEHGRYENCPDCFKGTIQSLHGQLTDLRNAYECSCKTELLFKEQLSLAQRQNEEQEIRLALWSATFSKYSSWKANGINRLNIGHVINDFEQCEKAASGKAWHKSELLNARVDAMEECAEIIRTHVHTEFEPTRLQVRDSFETAIRSRIEHLKKGEQ